MRDATEPSEGTALGRPPAAAPSRGPILAQRPNLRAMAQPTNAQKRPNQNGPNSPSLLKFRAIPDRRPNETCMAQLSGKCDSVRPNTNLRREFVSDSGGDYLSAGCFRADEKARSQAARSD